MQQKRSQTGKKLLPRTLPRTVSPPSPAVAWSRPPSGRGRASAPLWPSPRGCEHLRRGAGSGGAKKKCEKPASSASFTRGIRHVRPWPLAPRLCALSTGEDQCECVCVHKGEMPLQPHPGADYIREVCCHDTPSPCLPPLTSTHQNTGMLNKAMREHRQTACTARERIACEDVLLASKDAMRPRRHAVGSWRRVNQRQLRWREGDGDSKSEGETENCWKLVIRKPQCHSQCQASSADEIWREEEAPSLGEPESERFFLVSLCIKGQVFSIN